MDETAHAAAAEVARRRVKRAKGLLGESERELAQLAGDLEVIGSTRVHDAESTQAALDRIRLGLAQCGAVDVVVIARPTGRDVHPPRPDRAKEQTNGSQHSGDGRAAAGPGERGAVGGRT